MKRRRSMLVLLAAAAACRPGPAEAPITLKFCAPPLSEAPRARAAERFRQLAEERTQGRVRVELYPGSTLYAPKDQLEALQLGAVQMVAISLHNLAALGLRDFEAFELPYLFDSYEALHRVTDGPVGTALLAKLREKGIHGLGFWDIGFKQLTANRPLHGPEDARGLTIRTSYSRISDREVRALGATPQPTTFADIREGVGAGTLDGTELTAQLVEIHQVDEVQKYMTLSNHGYMGSALVVNRRFWERLPANVRSALEDAARDATAFNNEAARRAEVDAMRSLAARGRIRLIALSAGERRRWKQALMAVHRDSESEIPADTLASLYRATGFKAE